MVEVVQIRGRGGVKVIWTKSKRTATFFVKPSLMFRKLRGCNSPPVHRLHKKIREAVFPFLYRKCLRSEILMPFLGDFACGVIVVGDHWDSSIPDHWLLLLETIWHRYLLSRPFYNYFRKYFRQKEEFKILVKVATQWSVKQNKQIAICS